MTALSSLTLPDNVSDAFDLYNKTLCNVLDSHAPKQEKTISIRPKVPWFNDEILTAKREKRKAERKWRATRLEIHKQIFQAARNKFTYKIKISKAEFYKAQVEECENDQKKLFTVVDQLLHQKQAPALPSHSSAEKLASTFSEYFVSKIEKIRTDIDQKCNPTQQITTDLSCETMIDFARTTDEEVEKIIKEAKKSTCELDPIPTSLLKECVNAVLSNTTKIMNLSLSSGSVPSCLKHAIIRPLLKKSHLDHDTLKNYRPVSNLPFLSKVLEKIVARRLLKHMDDHNHHEIMQSAYKQYHSTETALIRVQNDILTHLDNKRGVVLVLLDLSAAFDTIDHVTLLHQLHHRLGISHTALEWFKSYLTGRTQAVSIENDSSKPVTLQYGVPQGSVLGPLLYTIYTLPLGDLLRNAGISYHFYADDTQLYLSFDYNDPSSQLECLEAMQRCVSLVKYWMTQNKLKLNDDKTEVIFISSRFCQKPSALDKFAVDSTVIQPATAVRNIGVMFDNTMAMSEQVTAICRAAHFHLRNIGRIRKCITYEACDKLIHAFVTSRIDCCNSVLYGLPASQLNRLQRMIHIAARILTLTPPSSHMTPILKNLHWLPIEQRIHYKILLLTFKALNGLAPQYLSSLLQPYSVEAYALRSNDNNKLVQPKARTKTYGERAFACAAPTLWNRLPVEIRSITSVNCFKTSIKTLLFKSVYL